MEMLENNGGLAFAPQSGCFFANSCINFSLLFYADRVQRSVIRRARRRT